MTVTGINIARLFSNHRGDVYWRSVIGQQIAAAKVKLLLRYGLPMATPNRQNWLIQLDPKTMKPTGVIAVRYLSDAAVVPTVLRAHGREAELRTDPFVAKPARRGQMIAPYTGLSGIGEAGDAIELLSYDLEIRKELQFTEADLPLRPFNEAIEKFADFNDYREDDERGNKETDGHRLERIKHTENLKELRGKLPDDLNDLLESPRGQAALAKYHRHHVAPKYPLLVSKSTRTLEIRAIRSEASPKTDY